MTTAWSTMPDSSGGRASPCRARRHAGAARGARGAGAQRLAVRDRGRGHRRSGRLADRPVLRRGARPGHPPRRAGGRPAAARRATLESHRRVPAQDWLAASACACRRSRPAGSSSTARRPATACLPARCRSRSMPASPSARASTPPPRPAWSRSTVSPAAPLPARARPRLRLRRPGDRGRPVLARPTGGSRQRPGRRARRPGEHRASTALPAGSRPWSADGYAHSLIRRRGPYDLVLANILADPLIELAPALTRQVAPGGFVVLSGLLDRQAALVERAYAAAGLRLMTTIARTPWMGLVFRRPRRSGRAGTG